MTNVAVDDIDFYVEKLSKDSTQYLLDGEWKDLLIKTEIIKTKEGDEIEKTLRFTHRGPIINDFRIGAEIPVSIRWLGNEMSNEIRTVFLLNRAKNWSDFRDAVKTFTSVSQNIVYADVAGNIGLQCSAGVPIRAGSGIQFYPGDSSKYDWTGLFLSKNCHSNLILNAVMSRRPTTKLHPTIIHITSVTGLPLPTELTGFVKCWKRSNCWELKILKQCTAM
jgi:acyl-homoserine lactone acylase PvdQ